MKDLTSKGRSRLRERIARLDRTELNHRSSGHREGCESFISRNSGGFFGNVILISAQRADATRVAGFNAWRRLGRSVRKGEKAIWILAPVVGRRSARADDEAGPAPGTAQPPAAQPPATPPPAAQPPVRGFRFVAVFDVAQTEGAELPAVCIPLEGGDDAGIFGRLVDFAVGLGFDVEDCELAGGTNGDCSHAERLIRVEVRRSPAQRVKTIAHELAHAILHESYDDRAVAELEAESTAYVVCRSLGIDSGSYSFGYVATWAGGRQAALDGIRASGERIQRAASRILASLESAPDALSGGRVDAA